MQASTLLSTLFVVSLPVALTAQSVDTPTTPPAADSPAETSPAPEANEPAGNTNGGEAVASPEELAGQQQELAELTREITALQQRAEDAEQVQTAKEDYFDILRAEMVRVAPNLETDIDRQAELVTELRKTAAEPAAEPATAEAVEQTAAAQQALLSEYQTLYAKISPVEKQVQTVPAVQEARSQYYTALIAEMERIDPETQTLLERHRELLTRVRTLPDSTGSKGTSG
jgi:hypothetical protein